MVTVKVAIKVGALLGAAMALYLAAALQIGPEVADANLCKLLRRFSSSLPDQCLSSLDGYWTIIALIVAFAFLVLLLWDFKNPVRAKCAQALGWGRPKIQRILARVEPSHVIILGLTIALIGVIWQWRKVPPTDPKIAQLQSQLGTAHTQIATLLAANKEFEEKQKQPAATASPDRVQPKTETPVSLQNDQHTIEWMPLFFGWNETDEGDLLVSVIMAGGTNRSNEPFTNLSAYVTPYNTHDKTSMMILGDRGEWLDPAKTYGIPPKVDFRFLMKIPPSDPKYTQGVSPDEYLTKYGGYKFEMEYNIGGVTRHETREFSFTDVKELILKENETRLARKREKNRPGIKSRE
jgi:hypothetical protein